VVDVILEAITRSVVADSRVEIRGFGSFSLSYRQPRIGRNPKSGEKVQVPGKHVPYFKAGKEMREGVNVR
jgi:integration host factor subunit beta